MAQKQEYLTSKRFEELKKELHHLRTVRRHEVADRILQAKDFGGTEDNAEFDDAKNAQAFIEGRILTIDNLLHYAIVIPEDQPKSDVVAVGTKVTVEQDKGQPIEYWIVGIDEADPKAGRISNESPVGSALIGSKAGDSVEVNIPAGVLKLTIKSVD